MKTIPYGHHYIDKDDIKEVIKVLKSDWITQGPRVKEFEDALCRYTGAKYAVAVSSGTAALHIACLAVEIKEGDEVITSPITFVASANCVLYCGGRPVFVDIQEDTVNIDPIKIEEYLKSKSQPQPKPSPKAIIPVHFAGHPCDLEEIHKIARENNLFVIEDACHALGAEYREKDKIKTEVKVEAKVKKNSQSQPKPKSFWSKIGSCKYSDMTVFSFHPVKSITTGEGGAVLTNKKDLYEKLLMLRSHGITKDPKKFLKNKHTNILTYQHTNDHWRYEMQLLGFNYRITDFQCALGISQLKKLDRFIERRREIVNIYNKEFSKIDDVILPIEKPYAKSSWHLYVIRLKNPNKRRGVFEKLRKSGIGVQVHYIPVHLHPYYRENFGYKEGDFPIAENYYKSAITLPLYPKMNFNQIKSVINIIKNILH